MRLLEAEAFRLMYQLSNSKQCSIYFSLHLLNYQILTKDVLGKRTKSTCPVVEDNYTTSCQDKKIQCGNKNFTYTLPLLFQDEKEIIYSTETL